MGHKIYFPVNYSPDDHDGKFPEDWDVRAEPDPSRAHDGWQITMAGDSVGLKGNQGVVITVAGIAFDLLQKYRDLKDLVFGSDIDPNQPFFVNYSGKPITILNSNAPGSLWHRFGQVTGVQNPGQNSVRRGLEDYCQKTDTSRKRIKAINNHSEDVGLSYYDGQAGDFRSGVVHTLSQMEGSTKRNSEMDEDVSEQIAEKRRKIDAEDVKKRSSIIEETLSKKTDEKLRYNLGKNMKVLPQDRDFFQKLLKDDKYLSFHGIEKEKKFPGGVNCT